MSGLNSIRIIAVVLTMSFFCFYSTAALRPRGNIYFTTPVTTTEQINVINWAINTSCRWLNVNSCSASIPDEIQQKFLADGRYYKFDLTFNTTGKDNDVELTVSFTTFRKYLFTNTCIC